MVKTTSNEQTVIRNIVNNEYANGDVFAVTWTWRAVEGVGKTPRSAGGVVSSLVKKGLVCADGYGEEATLSLTDAGSAVFAQLHAEVR
jgi:hypothetical protein